MKEFHLFTELPIELRLQIDWNFAFPSRVSAIFSGLFGLEEYLRSTGIAGFVIMLFNWMNMNLPFPQVDSSNDRSFKNNFHLARESTVNFGMAGRESNFRREPGPLLLLQLNPTNTPPNPPRNSRTSTQNLQTVFR